MSFEEIIRKRDGESDFEYHKRLVKGRIVDRTLADVDYAELSKYVYGRPYSSDHTRKMLHGSNATIDLIEKELQGGGHIDVDTLSEIDSKRIELQKERQRFFDQRAAFNKLVRERAREEELNDIITRAIERGTLPSLLPIEPQTHFDEDGGDLLVSLCDIHFGACVSNYWCEYNSDICAKMFIYYAKKVVEIARRHQARNCIIWANGDLISGSIHHTIQVSNQENIIQQITGVSELIAQFIACLSPHFEKVSYVSVSGNHSRIDTKERALMQERLDDLVECYLSARMQSFENVEIGYGKRIDSSMYVVDVRGKLYVGIHGDYDPSPAHIQALQTMVGAPVYAVLIGHKHHNATDIVQGIRTIMAGSFMGMDDFCVQKRIFGKPEQMVCVCNSDGIDCFYDVALCPVE